MLKKRLLAMMLGITCFATTAVAAPANLSDNTGVYYDKTLSPENYNLTDPATSPAKRWAVFYGPWSGHKTAYIEVIHDKPRLSG